MVHPCCEYPLQNCVSYLALYDIVWSFLRTIYHLNELLTTFDSWVYAGRIPDYGVDDPHQSFISFKFQQDPKKLLIWVILASLVIVLQLIVFQVSLLVGHYSSFPLETPPETFYEEKDEEYRVLKLPTQGISLLGTFWTLYEIWVVKLLIEELEDDSLYRDSSDDPLHAHPLSSLSRHRRAHPFNRNNP